MPAPVVNCEIQMVFLPERGALPQPGQATARQQLYLCPHARSLAEGGFVPYPYCWTATVEAPAVCGAPEGFSSTQEKQRCPSSPGGEEEEEEEEECDAAAVLQHAGPARCSVCPRHGILNVKVAALKYFRSLINVNVLCSAEDYFYSVAI